MHTISYFEGATIKDVPDDRTLLAVSIQHRIPHLHQCGAQGRCTTCRVQILDGLSHLSPPSPIEEKVASERGWDGFTRLACQTKVRGDVILRRLVDNPQDIIALDLDELFGTAAGEGRELELAVLFSDIRNFTTHSEANLPHDIVHMLNRHFTAAAEAVLNNNGFIDKYLGDGILAAFGARGESAAETCQNAVRAALLMQHAAQRLSPDFERDFNMPLRIGIGLHFGTVVLGRIGHPGERQITMIGDTVNTASRVEAMTKEIGVPILVSGSVAAQLPGLLRLGAPSEVCLKGRTESVILYPCEGFRDSDTIFLVQRSFDLVSARGMEFGKRFYENLFQANPELRCLFTEDLTHQTKMLVSMLSSAVKGLNRMQEIAGGLHELGKRHRDYKVTRNDYDKAAHALLKTLEEFLGEDFTPEVRQAWITVNSEIAGIMIQAAEG